MNELKMNDLYNALTLIRSYCNNVIGCDKCVLGNKSGTCYIKNVIPAEWRLINPAKIKLFEE